MIKKNYTGGMNDFFGVVIGKENFYVVNYNLDCFLDELSSLSHVDV